MKEQKYIEQLKKEGFKYIFTHEDSPNAYYPNHSHDSLTAHVVLEGELTLTIKGKNKTYKKGRRIDVNRDILHSAKIGPKGCRYIIGRK